MADKLFNWAFALNTGGIPVTITFYASTISKEKIKFPNTVFISLLVLFGLGVCTAILAVYIEQQRFMKKGSELDKAIEQHNVFSQDGRNNFYKAIGPNSSQSCYD